jgi:pre-mRNA-splicing factor ISY1
MCSDWLAATQAAAEVLNCELSDLPSQPKPSSSKTPLAAPTTATSSTSAAKRKATDQDDDVEMVDESSKKSKGEDESATPATEAISAEVQAAAASFMSIFDPASLVTPQLPTREEMASALLDVRKKALMAEYGVEE